MSDDKFRRLFYATATPTATTEQACAWTRDSDKSENDSFISLSTDGKNITIHPGTYTISMRGARAAVAGQASYFQPYISDQMFAATVENTYIAAGQIPRCVTTVISNFKIQTTFTAGIYETITGLSLSLIIAKTA